VVPKVYATKYPQVLAQLMSFPFVILNRIFHPLSYVLVKSTNLIDKRLKKKANDISVDELSHALEITSDESAGDDDKKILKGIVKFGNTDTKQVMTPRVDVIAFDIETPFQELIEGIVDSGFSRLPIYEGDFDQIKGVLYIKDLLPFLDETEGYEWQKLIREPLYVPENKKIDDLLEEFQEKKIHLAVVVDEYGGSQGIVTLEDVIEEIVGDISDEFDEEDLVYSKLDEHNYVFEAKTPLKDVYKVLEINGEDFEEEKGEADTLGGFVVEISGKIPKKNERIKFNEYTLTVEAADKRKVKRVKITLPDDDEEQEETSRWRSRKSAFFFALFVALTACFASCEDETYTPKPRSYFRIAIPQHEYTSSNLDCPFRFEYPTNSHLNSINKGNCWFNLSYPKLAATVHFTYYSDIADSVKYFTEDARKFAMKHTVKADNIEESVIRDPESSVYGMIYNFEGSVASNYQFFLTDSVNHFIRGAMYFDVEPNPDSLAPVEKHIKEDLLHLIETFEWVSEEE
jgi:gliding motility-associated lipoprotein GldD